MGTYRRFSCVARPPEALLFVSLAIRSLLANPTAVFKGHLCGCNQIGARGKLHMQAGKRRWLFLLTLGGREVCTNLNMWSL